jgi:hypothetical protein
MPERSYFVRCKNCGHKLEIDARSAARIRDDFSLPCPTCGRRLIYSRDDFEYDRQRLEAG